MGNRGKRVTEKRETAGRVKGTGTGGREGKYRLISSSHVRTRRQQRSQPSFCGHSLRNANARTRVGTYVGRARSQNSRAMCAAQWKAMVNRSSLIIESPTQGRTQCPSPPSIDLESRYHFRTTILQFGNFINSISIHFQITFLIANFMSRTYYCVVTSFLI